MLNAQSKMAVKEGGDMAPSGADAAYSSWPSAAARESVWGVGTEQVSGSCGAPCHSSIHQSCTVGCLASNVTVSSIADLPTPQTH